MEERVTNLVCEVVVNKIIKKDNIITWRLKPNTHTPTLTGLLLKSVLESTDSSANVCVGSQ